jgi:enediyne biosynthesis protein E4
MKNIFTILFVIIAIQLAAQKIPLFSLLSSKQTGIDFNNVIEESNAQNVLAYEYMYNGGGVATGDINNDGWDDIFFTANLRSNKLYLNQGNFSFRDITRTSRVGGRRDWKTGVTMVDINGDGWLDIYVCYSGKGNADSRRNELYINNHDLTFTESAKKFGLDDAGCSTQAIFFDYDRDGDLDCYVLNHNIRAYKNIELHYLKNDYDSLAADRLYRNDEGQFSDVSKQAGIIGNPISFGLGVSVSDINNDGWPDIYVSNDYTEQDYCFINNGNGSFSQKEMFLFSHLSQFSMGSEMADFNNDGLVDILTLDMLPEDNRRQKLLQGQENYELYQYMAANGFHFQFMRNMLQLNNGNGTFSEIGQLAGISNTDWSWAPLFADLDNDGHKDLFVTNGYMRDYTNKDFLKYWGDYLVKQVANRDSIHYLELVKQMPSTMVANYAFCNNADLTFKNTSADWGLKQLALSNGAAYSDLDNDGDLDLVVNNINDKAFVFRNEANSLLRRHFLSVRLQGEGWNRFGMGAKIFCYAGGGLQLIEQMTTRGYQSSVSPVLHFGLADHSIIDSLKITWPQGKVQVLYNIKTNQLLDLNEKNALATGIQAIKKSTKLFSYQKSIINFSHLQLEYNDFKRQPLIPVMISPVGPKFSTGDVNGDGRDDIFFGSSQGQGSELHIQGKNGFVRSAQPVFTADSFSSTTAVLFFDANGDKHPDIYEVSGGYNDFVENDPRLQDRLFFNDGKGNFQEAKNSLPVMMSSKSCVAAADIDGDGDSDLFVGGRVIPGKYPVIPRSYLLLNDGKGNFSDVTEKWSEDLSYTGMVTDAKWNDINKDGRPDLILIGEWMAPTIFLNSGTHLSIFESRLSTLTGWWNSLELADIDNDGDTDLIAGNWGLNSQLHCSDKEPLEMFSKDFDNNGSVDPFLCCYTQNKSYPYVSRDELLDQVYPMRRKFTSYKSYANATMTDIFSVEELKDAQHLRASCLETMIFENNNGVFHPRPIPLQAQFSPVYKIVVEDVNKDGSPDLLLFGNNDYPRLKIGKMDANFGTVLLNDGKGIFKYASFAETGLHVPGDVKEAAMIKINDAKYLLIGVNNSDLLNYKLN